MTAGPSLGARLMLGLYGLAWRAALPGLGRNKRLREGWAQRTLAQGPPPKADVWMQAASGGEAYLAWELLTKLSQHNIGAPLAVLCTTFTSQGLGILERAKEALAPRVAVIPAYVPFDLPGRMRFLRACSSARVVSQGRRIFTLEPFPSQRGKNPRNIVPHFCQIFHRLFRILHCQIRYLRKT